MHESSKTKAGDYDASGGYGGEKHPSQQKQRTDPNLHFVESPVFFPPEVMIDMEAHKKKFIRKAIVSIHANSTAMFVDSLFTTRASNNGRRFGLVRLHLTSSMKRDWVNNLCTVSEDSMKLLQDNVRYWVMVFLNEQATMEFLLLRRICLGGDISKYSRFFSLWKVGGRKKKKRWEVKISKRLRKSYPWECFGDSLYRSVSLSTAWVTGGGSPYYPVGKRVAAVSHENPLCQKVRRDRGWVVPSYGYGSDWPWAALGSFRMLGLSLYLRSAFVLCCDVRFRVVNLVVLLLLGGPEPRVYFLTTCFLTEVTFFQTTVPSCPFIFFDLGRPMGGVDTCLHLVFLEYNEVSVRKDPLPSDDVVDLDLLDKLDNNHTLLRKCGNRRIPIMEIVEG
ncbi:hypothetical protein Tco_1133222 [Tanacetum coccineum]